jgi:hypothetical protein
VGAVFWIAALLSLAYSLTAFVVQVFNQAGGAGGFTTQNLIDQGLGAQDIITLVSDLLLTLIIMEVFGTRWSTTSVNARPPSSRSSS